MLENGSALLLQPSLSENLLKTMLSILIILTKSTGTSFPLPTLMVMPTAGSMTGSGGRQGQNMAPFLDARELIQTETGTFTGLSQE